MTLKEEIAKNRADARDNFWKDMIDEEIDLIINRIDKIEEHYSDLRERVENIELQMHKVTGA